MHELELILKGFESIVRLVGPYLATFLVLGVVYLYFKYFHAHLKNGGVLVFGKTKQNETEDEIKERERIENSGAHSLTVGVPAYCLARLGFCKEEFKRIEEHLIRSDEKFDQRGTTIAETHEDVAVIRALMGNPKRKERDGMKKYFLFLISLIGLVIISGASLDKNLEKHYQTLWCNQQNGQMEVVLSDGSRCDCVTKTHAVEAEFSHKWSESIGQSLLYSALTGKRAGILLIMKKGDEPYLKRLNTTIDRFKLPIDVWIIKY